ncbi:hypothetical protein GIS00_23935 [Nakamurella sp. YIM 132087]|uniref:VanZ-like domain-containing protein n=1 Tax=Nakamurella alba TaxID=2665158 RepID=A0A7K1FSD8_9ACTN|nr:VanZ family protein [Nakamurella alba]MTD16990.1 hypothetical protein [Nakamurella alba]
MSRRVALPDGVADPNRTARRCCTVLLLLVLAFIGWIVLKPGPPAGVAQLGLRGYLWHGGRHGLPSWVSFDFVESLANVIMFVPLGLFGALAVPRMQWLVWPACTALSGVIETLQALLLPGRYGMVEDVVVNSLGALIGVLLAVPVLVSRRRRYRRAAAGRRSAKDRVPRSARQTPNGSVVRPTRSATELITSDGRNG